MVSEMPLVFGKVLGANILDRFQLFIVLLIYAGIVRIDSISSLLDIFPDSLNFRLQIMRSIFFFCGYLALQRYSNLMMLYIVGLREILLSFLKFFNGLRELFLDLHAVFLGSYLVLQHSVFYLIVRLVLQVLEVLQFLQVSLMLYQVLFALSDFTVMLSKTIVVVILALHELFVEFFMLLVQLVPCQVDLVVQSHCSLEEVLTLIIEFVNVYFIVTDSLLSDRLVHERKENISDVLNAKLPGL